MDTSKFRVVPEDRNLCPISRVPILPLTIFHFDDPREGHQFETCQEMWRALEQLHLLEGKKDSGGVHKKFLNCHFGSAMLHSF